MNDWKMVTKVKESYANEIRVSINPLTLQIFSEKFNRDIFSKRKNAIIKSKPTPSHLIGTSGFPTTLEQEFLSPNKTPHFTLSWCVISASAVRAIMKLTRFKKTFCRLRGTHSKKQWHPPVILPLPFLRLGYRSRHWPRRASYRWNSITHKMCISLAHFLITCVIGTCYRKWHGTPGRVKFNVYYR